MIIGKDGRPQVTDHRADFQFMIDCLLVHGIITDGEIGKIRKRAERRLVELENRISESESGNRKSLD